MKQSDPKIRNLATQILLNETEKQSAEINIAAAVLVCEKLRPQLAILMGKAGFRALLSRALALARTEIPWLRVLHVKADGSLEGMDEPAQVDPKKITEGVIALITQLLGLLVAFIGENLTLGLINEVWPKLSLNDLNFGKGRKHEKAK